ncbi:MAG: hypothetical protein EZS28_031536, partial [Streblomastix strix]
MDAIHLLHVSPNLQPFLGFQFKNRSYAQLGLPFGWRRSPLLFSMTLAIAIRAIREKLKEKIQNYLNGIIIIHQSKHRHKQMTLEILHFLLNLSWRFTYKVCNGNEEKLPKFKMKLPNLIYGRNNDSDKKMKHEIQTERLDLNEEREIKFNYLKSCIINQKNQLSSVLVSTSISLDECNQQAQDQCYSKMRLGCICETLEANSGQPLDNSDIIQMEKTTQNEEQNYRFITNNRCERKQMRYDSGIQIKVKNGRLSIVGLMAHPLKQIEWKIKCILLKTDNATTEFSIRRWRAASAILHLVREIFLLLD